MYLEGKTFDPANIDDINTISANCGIEIGNLPSRLIEVFRKYLPGVSLDWDYGCKHFWIDGIKYGMHLNFYWSNRAPKFYKAR